MNNVALQLLALRQSFGRRLVLAGLDLDLREGELLALVGPSGGGKSTVLHLIAGLLAPDSGDIRLLGRSLLGVRPGERDVALVFQDGALYPHLTVAENLAFPLRARGKEGHQAVRRMAERLDLTPVLGRYPHQISGGERQRTALGRALIRKPKLFLLDEPLSSLDLPLRERMRTLIRELVAETGVTTIYVTHDQAEAMAVGDRIAVLHDGRFHQVGTPRQIYERPAHEFVGRFFGQPPMNLLRGELRDGVVLGAWGKLQVSEKMPGGAVLCGFRPEDALVNTSGEGLSGTLTRLEYQGHEVIATLRLADAEVRLRLANDHGLSAGMAIGVTVSADQLHIFDAASGERR
jgi:ABC-type sugar transport system ATPase subunit